MFWRGALLSSNITQAVPEGHYGMRSDGNREAGVIQHAYVNNTYKGLRIFSPEYSLYYSVWCTNETEFFDLKVRVASSRPCF
jgi:hypothetical protein